MQIAANAERIAGALGPAQSRSALCGEGRVGQLQYGVRGAG